MISWIYVLPLPFIELRADVSVCENVVPLRVNPPPALYVVFVSVLVSVELITPLELIDTLVPPVKLLLT